MTNNQVNWVNAQENKRANLANEEIKREQNAITQSHNVMDEAIRVASNRITEGHYVRQDAETNRSNLANEALKGRQMDISEYEAQTNRYNAKTNRLNYNVNKRNAATNEKNAETNLINAHANVLNAYTNQRNANTNAFVAETGRLQYGESVRHNLAEEGIKSEANRINETYNTEKVRQTDYINSVNAVYMQNQISNANKQTSSNVENQAADTAVKHSTVPLNEARTKESKSKKILNYTDVIENITDVVTGWANLLK